MNFVQWDYYLFKLINQGLSLPVLEELLPWLRAPLFWLPLYIFIIAFVLFNFGKKSYWIIIFTILTVSTADLVSSRIIKTAVQRLRPCRTENLQVIQRVPCGSGYSFTSSHATNHFSVATFLALTLGQFRPGIRWSLWTWAGAISFAQVFVGVHFPVDILAGAIMGIIIGKLWGYLFFRYYGHILNIYKTANES